MDINKLLEDFKEARRNGFVEVKNLKDQGRQVIGVYCGFAPWEIITASGAVAAWLCGMAEETIPDAERELPKALCPLIKSSYGFALTGKCPYFYFSDMLIGETTCDGKKKMYEYLGTMKPMHVMHLPQNPHAEDTIELYKHELYKLKESIEKELDVTITEDDIKERIKIRNEEKRALREFYELGKLNPPPLYGFHMRKVISSTLFISDKEREIENIKSLTAQLREDYEISGTSVPKGAKRILVTGSPLGDSTEKVIKIIEENGGVVVCFECCSSAKSVDDLVDENKAPMDALAERYMKSGCACMSPNDHRIEMIGNYIEEYKVDGVIDVILEFCHTYNVETKRIKETANSKGVPYLNIETEYSQEDIGQLTTRISAFMEML